MKREIVTARDISQAVARGLSELAVAKDAIITEQAGEDARRLGLKLCTPDSGLSDPASGQAAVKSDVPAQLPSLPFLRSAAAPSKPALRTPPDSSPDTPSDTPSDRPQNIEVYDLVRKAVAKELERSRSSASPACQGLQGGSACVAGSGKPEAPQTRDEGGGLKYSTAGRVKAVDAQKLPWENFSGQSNGRVNIVDVITSGDGSPMGGGYLEWNDVSFAWKLTYAEIDVVLEGELHISSGGKTVVGRPGDMLFIPCDTEVVFSAPGYVRFAYVTWPADWSSLVEPQDGGS